MGKIPFVKIEAENNYDFGFKLGQALKKRIRKRLEDNKIIYKIRSLTPRDFEDLKKKTKKFYNCINKYFPYLLEEAKGIAEGAKVNFEDLFVIMCDEELVNFDFCNHCTTVSVKTSSGDYLLGHNEDWFPEFRSNGLFLVRGRIGKNKFLSLGYIGNMVGSAGGMNSFCAYSDTTLYARKIEHKIPRSFHLRSLLDAKTPANAKRFLDCQGSLVSNTMFAFCKEGLLDIEELYSKEDVFCADNWIIHTNHPLLEEDRNPALKKDEEESILRFDRAKELLLKSKKFDKNSIIRVLSDHKTDICGHIVKKTNDATVTIASYIFNPKKKYMLLSETNPCKKKFKKYYL